MKVAREADMFEGARKWVGEWQVDMSVDNIIHTYIHLHIYIYIYELVKVRKFDTIKLTNK